LRITAWPINQIGDPDLILPSEILIKRRGRKSEVSGKYLQKRSKPGKAVGKEGRNDQKKKKRGIAFLHRKAKLEESRQRFQAQQGGIAVRTIA